MEQKEILRKVDHTLLKPTATWEQIQEVLEDAMAFQCASACIPPVYVRQAAQYVNGRLPICTVIGFPHGNMTTASKLFEAREALENGASEIDMVIHIGDVKAGRLDAVENEIRQMKELCQDQILKVIVETALLDEAEINALTLITSHAGADYIKTSTGFSDRGASFQDVALMKKFAPAGLKIKAAGGISDFADAEKFIELGADRLGTSRLVRLAKEQADSQLPE